MGNSLTLSNRLPFSNTKLVLAIIAIISAPFLVGFLFGVIALYLAGKDSQMLKSFSENYSGAALKHHRIGSILSWSGFLISTILGVIIIYLYLTYGTLDLNMIELLKSQKA